MRHPLATLLACLCCAAAAQRQTFVPGYLVPPGGDTARVLIADRGQSSSPRTFTYRVDAEAPVQEGDGASATAFGIDGGNRYTWRAVRVNRAPTRTKSLSGARAPKFEGAEAYIRVLALGAVDLYVYREGDTRQFFARAEGSTALTPLIYHRYRAGGGTDGQLVVRENRDYAQWLSTKLRCDGLPPQRFAATRYEERALVRLVEAYNACREPTYVNPIAQRARIAPRVWMRPMVGLADVHGTNLRGTRIDPRLEGSALLWGVALALEQPLRLDRGRWSALAEPSLRRMASDNHDQVERYDGSFIRYAYAFDYWALDIGVGGRYHVAVGARLRLHAEALATINLLTRSNYTLRPFPAASYNFLAHGARLAVGIDLDERFSVSVARPLTRVFLGGAGNASISYRATVLLLGVRLR